MAKQLPKSTKPSPKPTQERSTGPKIRELDPDVPLTEGVNPRSDANASEARPPKPGIRERDPEIPLVDTSPKNGPQATHGRSQGPKIVELDPDPPTGAAASAQSLGGRAGALRRSGITQAMIDAQKQIREKFFNQPSSSRAELSSSGSAVSSAVGPENFLGSYIGLIEEGGRPTGKIGVIVAVREKHPSDRIPEGLLLPSSLSNVRVDVIALGDLYALQEGYRSREIPARYGASIQLSTANSLGTLGCLVHARHGDDEAVCILSNNHVLANTNAGSIWDDVLQPGGGDAPQQGFVGKLFRYLELTLGYDDSAAIGTYSNRIDGALAWTRFEHCEPKLHGDIPFVGEIAEAELEMLAMKQGRTTGHTRGEVIGMSGQFRISYNPSGQGPPWGDFTEGQILLRGTNMRFSKPGDSGSLVFGKVPGGNWQPIGLLFAGNDDGITVANPIGDVMSLLSITKILSE